MAEVAVRTGDPVDMSDPLHKCGHRFDHGRLWLGHFECGAGRGQTSAFVRRAEYTVVANALESAG